MTKNDYLTYDEFCNLNPNLSQREKAIEFAKYHMKKALIAANNNATIECSMNLQNKTCYACYGGGCESPVVDPKTILESYSEKNIQ